MTDRDQEIIGRLRRAYEAYNRGDFDGAKEIAHPDIEFVRAGGQATLVGSDALRAWMEPDAFEEMEIELCEIRINGNQFLVRQHSRARGAGSGIEMDADFWVVWTVDSSGLARRVESFFAHQRKEAFAAAGLSE